MIKFIFFSANRFIHKMASASKKAKIDKTVKNNPFENHPEVNNSGNLLNTIQKLRNETANSVLEFDFAKKRVAIISHAKELPEKCQGVMYWMSRDARVQDNWAFLFAQKLALKNQVPLHVTFCLAPGFVPETYRHYHFLLKGLEEVAADCKKLNIHFNLLKGNSESITEWVVNNKMGAVVCDFNPLRTPRAWRDEIKSKLPEDIPLIQVDAHNIVPCLVSSDKLEYSARTIRNKINSKLDDFLTEFPPVIKHKYSSKLKIDDIDWDKELESLDVDKKVSVCEWAKPGSDAGLKMLEQFIDKRLKLFGSKRNNPVDDVISKLSPWFRFGQVSVQRAVLCVQKLKTKHIESVNAFCEEAIIRRELSDNFCYYNEHYDSIKGASNWAQKTLDDHRKDKRAYVYTLEQLTDAKTHDDLWNSAQIQLLKEGKMHGFLRMYWAKKILEWSPSPEDALQYALHLNDFYSLDGTDPNGFVGCMWSICGIHDQGWTERPIFGKIRFMNYDGCKRKFDVKAFVARYGGKAHKYVAAKS